MDVIEMRAFVRAYQDLKNAKSEGDVPKSRAADLVWEVQAEVAARRSRGEFK